MKSLKIALFLVICTALAAAGERKFEKSFTVSPGGKLVVATDIGSIEVTGSETNEVSVVARMEGSQRDIDDFQIEARQTDGGVEVMGKTRRGSWFWNTSDLDVSYTIRVPSSYAVKLATSGGNVSVGRLKGSVDGVTSGGNIGLREIEGPATMETSGGNVMVERVTGSVRVSTSGGEVRAKEVKGDLRATTSGGNMDFTGIDGRLTAETSGGNISVELASASKGVSVETSGGDIDIVIPAHAGASIDASTSGGEVTCDLPITMQGKYDTDRLRGTVNGGGEMVRASTSGGDIRIRGTR